MQEFRDLGPHLINVAMSDDRMPVYALGFGIRFSNLTDDEKESARREAAGRPHRTRVLVQKIRKKNDRR